MPKIQKVGLHESYYMPILTYRTEPWAQKKADISILTAAEMGFSGVQKDKSKETE
jgi:hypothetical protein